jgi:hypothetical protein
MGVDPHVRELVVATITCLASAELAGAPLLLSRGGDQAAIVQACLVGSLVHLFACILIATALVLSKLIAGAPYLFWLLGLYWVSLMFLVVVFIKAIRSAPLVGASRH